MKPKCTECDEYVWIDNMARELRRKYVVSTVLTYVGMVFGAAALMVAMFGCAPVYPNIRFQPGVTNRSAVEDSILRGTEWFAEQRGVTFETFASCLVVTVYKEPFGWPGFDTRLAGLHRPCEIHISWHKDIPENAYIHELWHRWDWLNEGKRRGHHPEDFIQDVARDKEAWRARHED